MRAQVDIEEWSIYKSSFDAACSFEQRRDFMALR